MLIEALHGSMQKNNDIPPPRIEIMGDDELFGVRDFFNRTIEFGSQKQRGVSDISFITVNHFVPTLTYFLDALSKIGDVSSVIPKGSGINRHTQNSVVEKYNVMQISRQDLIDNAKSTLRLLFSARSVGRKFIIFDIGGYFSSCIEMLSKEFRGIVLGIIEDTENGLQKYEKKIERYGSDKLIPVFSVARSELKQIEDNNVGLSIVRATDTLLRIGAHTILERMRYIGVIGFGKIGRSIADKLNSSGIGCIHVYDKKPEMALMASSDAAKFKIVAPRNRDEFLKNARMLFCASGNKSLSGDDFDKLSDNVFIASCTSSDDEFDLSWLKENSTEYISTKTREISVFVLKDGRRINLLRKGNSVNFAFDAVNGPNIYAVQAELILLALKIIQSDDVRDFKKISIANHGETNKVAYYYGLPSQDVTKIASLWMKYFSY